MPLQLAELKKLLRGDREGSLAEANGAASDPANARGTAARTAVYDIGAG